jgi:glyoxylase-like metal-dependent hydrolase (beta-lactamase superfamily II)
LLGLWRESDRLALVSDAVYTFESQTGGDWGRARVPHRAFNLDGDEARRSILKIAALEPRTVWGSHANPIVGDCRAQLERAVIPG